MLKSLSNLHSLHYLTFMILPIFQNFLYQIFFCFCLSLLAFFFPLSPSHGIFFFPTSRSLYLLLVHTLLVNLAIWHNFNSLEIHYTQIHNLGLVSASKIIPVNCHDILYRYVSYIIPHSTPKESSSFSSLHSQMCLLPIFSISRSYYDPNVTQTVNMKVTADFFFFYLSPHFQC